MARGIINCTQKVANRINYPWPAGASFSYFLLYLPFLSFFPFFFLSCRCCFSREILPSHSRGSTINHLSLGNCLEVWEKERERGGGASRLVISWTNEEKSDGSLFFFHFLGISPRLECSLNNRSLKRILCTERERYWILL